MQQIPKDMNLPGYKLHKLSGKEKGTLSVWINGNGIIEAGYWNRNFNTQFAGLLQRRTSALNVSLGTCTTQLACPAKSVKLFRLTKI
jgi:hypothetical protein